MKKLFAISILLTLITAAAFAQFKVSATVEFQGDVLRTAAPIDNARDTSKTDAALTGGTGYEKRYFNFLSSMDYWNGSEIKLNFSYTDPDDKDDPKYGGLLQLGIDALWIQLITQNNPSLMDVVTAPFGDWNAWGKVGILKGFVGNTDNRGATADWRGAHYNDYMDKFKFEPLGIMGPATLPNAAAGNLVGHNDLDGSDLRADSVYVSVEAALGPITAAVAGDMSGIVKTGINQEALDSHTGIGAGFRISGDVSIVKFDAIYKVTGAEATTDANQGANNSRPQPNGDGLWNHQFGLYGNANLGIIGLTAGYTGAFSYQETGTAGARNPSYVYPYWSGIDLRAFFNGVDKLKVSFNNNFSFSYLKGSNDGNTAVNGFTGNDMNNSEYSDGYFGMYNALLADFSLTDDLLLSFQVGNRWWSTTWTDTRASKTYTRVTNADELQLALAGVYTLGSHVTLGSGLVFNLYHQTLSQTDVDDSKTGLFTFGIPLTVKVAY